MAAHPNNLNQNSWPELPLEDVAFTLQVGRKRAPIATMHFRMKQLALNISEIRVDVAYALEIRDRILMTRKTLQRIAPVVMRVGEIGPAVEGIVGRLLKSGRRRLLAAWWGRFSLDSGLRADARAALADGGIEQIGERLRRR